MWGSSGRYLDCSHTVQKGSLQPNILFARGRLPKLTSSSHHTYSCAISIHHRVDCSQTPEPAIMSDTEIEAQPLLIEDEKLSRTMDIKHSKKPSRLRSWAMTVMTHTIVALLVVMAVVPSLKSECLSPTNIKKSGAQSTLYCMSVRILTTSCLLLTNIQRP